MQASSNTRWIFDKLYGTRMYTSGAELQLPRKIPMRVEPKSYFANERTFLGWMGMAITLGGVSAMLTGFSSIDASKPETEQLISSRTIDIITCIYTPLSMIIMCYALFTFYWRSRFMEKKQMGFFDDKVGPITVAVLVILTLSTVTVVALRDFFM